MNNDFLLCVASEITGLSDKHHNKHHRHPREISSSMYCIRGALF